MPETQVHSAIDHFLKSIDFAKFGPDTPAQKDVAWTDPLRQFSEIGMDLPAELRSWLILPIEQRMEYVQKHADLVRADNEDPDSFQVRLNKRWRNFAFIVQEELRAFTLPQLAGRGSREIIAAAVNAIAPKSKR